MGWICQDCSKRKNNKCDFLINDNCYKPIMKTRIKDIIRSIFKLKL